MNLLIIDYGLCSLLAACPKMLDLWCHLRVECDMLFNGMDDWMLAGFTLQPARVLCRLTGCKFAGRPFIIGPCRARAYGRLRFNRYAMDSQQNILGGQKSM